MLLANQYQGYEAHSKLRYNERSAESALVHKNLALWLQQI